MINVLIDIAFDAVDSLVDTYYDNKMHQTKRENDALLAAKSRECRQDKRRTVIIYTGALVTSTIITQAVKKGLKK